MINIIAEIGVNHDGNIQKAIQLIDCAKEAGADCVKFQTYNAETLALGNPSKVSYQKQNEGNSRSHFEMLKSLELSRDDHIHLFKYCENKGIEFMSTPYDTNSAKFLINLGVKRIKIASADIVDFDIHDYLAKNNIPVILSTGMASLGEIDDCVQRYNKHHDLSLLHCTSNYPCSDNSVNLRALTMLKNTFNKTIGYSDHTDGCLAACLSVALGATIIEKHVTINKYDKGPDHIASLEMDEFKNYCSALRKASNMLGDQYKQLQDEEISMHQISRKSLTLNKSVEIGEIITREKLIMSRPGTGLSWNYRQHIEGRKVRVNLHRGHQIRLSDLE